MKIDGVSIPITVESYIWLIERVHHIKVVKNKYINDESSPYDILGYMLNYTIQEDMIYNRYMHRENNHYHGDELLGNLDMQDMISNLSFVNGKVLGELYYTKYDRVFNTEILSMIHKALDVLIENKKAFNDKNIYRNIELLSNNTIFTKYNDKIDINNLETKYFTTNLYNIIKVCKLIFDSELKRQDKETNSFVDDCTLISIRHLIEHALRVEIQKLLKNNHIKVFKDTMPESDTTLKLETDITVLGNKITVIEVKTGKLNEDKRREWVHQTLAYMFTSADKYNKANKDINGIVLYLVGQKKDSKLEYSILDFNTMDDLIKAGNSVTVAGIDMAQHDSSIIDKQIKHLAKLIMEYNIE